MWKPQSLTHTLNPFIYAGQFMTSFKSVPLLFTCLLLLVFGCSSEDAQPTPSPEASEPENTVSENSDPRATGRSQEREEIKEPPALTTPSPEPIPCLLYTSDAADE